jgi:phage protein D
VKPTVKIIVAGNDRTADITARGMIVEWSDSVDEQADALTISVADTGGAIGIPILGATIELSAGYNGALQRVGSFTVESTELEGPPDRLTVTASSAPIAQAASIAGRASQSWEDTTLGAVAQAIAGRLGVSLAIDQQLAAVAVDNEQQTDESDTNFLLRLVRREGGFLKFTDGRMVIAREGAGIGTSGAALSVTLARATITSWRVQAGGKTGAIKKVKARVRNYEEGTDEDVEVNVPQSSSLADFSGPDATTTFQAVYDYATRPQAEAAAKTTASRIARASRQIELTLPGRLDIVAGGKVQLASIRQGVDGEWLVKSVRHRIDSGGWSMQVSGEGAA